jgi:uncharacterized protein with PIN domain
VARRAEVAEPVRQCGSVRLLLDEMYPQALAEKLRAQGHDVVAVTEDPDLVGSNDESVLAYAHTAQRCLVTENVQDFAVLAKHTTHHGILLVHPRRWPRDSSGIARLATALDRTIREERLPGADESHWLT